MMIFFFFFFFLQKANKGLPWQKPDGIKPVPTTD